MSTIEYCQRNNLTDFKTIKESIKESTINLFETLSSNIGNKFSYIGISIYNKMSENDNYEVYYSLSVYENRHSSVSISENDFSGFLFSKIKGNDIESDHQNSSYEYEEKEHSYLSLFFDDIQIGNQNKKYYSFIVDIQNYKIQIYLILKNDVLNPAENKEFGKRIHSFCNNLPLKCIPYSNIKLKFKKGIKKLSDEYVLIVDLIRSDERMKFEYLNMDAILTSNLIYKIKTKAGIANFKSINHTGDGFVFLYRGERDNIENDIKLLIQELNNVMKDFHSFLGGLNQVAQSYKLRSILSLCKTIFEIDYLNSIDKKLYFSSELDKTFEKMFSIKNEESNLFSKNNSLIFILKIDDSVSNGIVENMDHHFYKERSLHIIK